ncbi:MAG: hypothetical protein WC382_04950 [Methanoregulaceae archaeon]
MEKRGPILPSRVTTGIWLSGLVARDAPSISFVYSRDFAERPAILKFPAANIIS